MAFILAKSWTHAQSDRLEQTCRIVDGLPKKSGGHRIHLAYRSHHSSLRGFSVSRQKYILDRSQLIFTSVQPPGQFHAVYTPVKTLADGGHALNFEWLHLTELSRYLDIKKGQYFTNQVHEHSLETLQRMVVNLPRINRRISKQSLFTIAPI
jgi:hypothetical protein